MSSTLIILVLGSNVLFAQDNIILKNGTELSAKVLEVSASQIKYKRQDNPEGPVYCYTIKDVLLIKYANGTKDVFGNSVSIFSPANLDTPQGGIPLVKDPIFYKKSFFASPFADAQGKRLPAALIRSILMLIPSAYASYQRGKALRIGGYVISGAGLGLIGGGLALLAAGGSQADHQNKSGMELDNSKSYGQQKGQDHHNNGDLKDAGFVIAGAGMLTGLVGIWLSHRATVQFRRASDQFNSSRPVSLQFGPSRRGLGVGLALTF